MHTLLTPYRRASQRRRENKKRYDCMQSAPWGGEIPSRLHTHYQHNMQRSDGALEAGGGPDDTTAESCFRIAFYGIARPANLRTIAARMGTRLAFPCRALGPRSGHDSRRRGQVGTLPSHARSLTRLRLPGTPRGSRGGLPCPYPCGHRRRRPRSGKAKACGGWSACPSLAASCLLVVQGWKAFGGGGYVVSKATMSPMPPPAEISRSECCTLPSGRSTDAVESPQQR